MTDIANNPAQGAQGQGTAVPATAPSAVVTPAPAATPGLDFQRMSIEQFNARLQAEREAATRAAIGSLGVESLEAAKARIAKATELERAQMSEAEKITARLKELEPAAAKATEFEAALKAHLAAREAAIPEAQRTKLKLAPTDTVARLKWLDDAHAEGLFSAAPTTPATPANMKPGGVPPLPATPGQKPVDQMTPAERASAWEAYRASLNR